MLKAFFYSAALVATLFFLAAFDIPHATVIAEQELQAVTFEPLAYALLFCTGALCAVPSRFHGRVSQFFERQSPKVCTAYEISAGSVLGWGVGSGVAMIIQQGILMLPLVIGVCSIFLLLSMTPLWAAESAGDVATKYKQFMIAERKGLFVLKLGGIAFILLASWGFVQWWNNG